MDVHPTKNVSIGIDPYPDLSIELDRIGLKTTYHLVMTFTVSELERSTMLLMGKPSISIRAIYTMAMLNASSGWWLTYPSEKSWSSSNGMMTFIYMESHKSHVNQTTNQQNYLLVSWSSLQPVGTSLAGNDWQIFRDLTGKMA